MTFDEGQGYAVLATLLAPLVAMTILIFVPAQRKDLVRLISVVFASIMLGLSMYIFVAYQAGGEDIQMQLRWAWVENTGFLGENGISLHLGVDGISALLTLLNGVVVFAGTITSWKLDFRTKDFFILFWALVAGV